MCEVHEGAVDMIGQKRAAPATLLPPRTEHEMIDDQLATSLEEIAERLLAVGRVENVVLLDLHPRQLASLGAHLVTEPGEFLLLAQVLLARGEPLISRNGSVV